MNFIHLLLTDASILQIYTFRGQSSYSSVHECIKYIECIECIEYIVWVVIYSSFFVSRQVQILTLLICKVDSQLPLPSISVLIRVASSSCCVSAPQGPVMGLSSFGSDASGSLKAH